MSRHEFCPEHDQGKRRPQTSGALNIDLSPARFEFILSNGIAFRQQLALKPGKYHLVLGVNDAPSHKPGTVETQIELPVK